MTNIQIIVTIVGIVFSIISSFVLFYLNSIKFSQMTLVEEIKEMNKDIRDMLVNIAKSDEHFSALTNRIQSVERYQDELGNRLHNIELKNV